MWESSIEEESTLENVANNLIKMKIVSMDISYLEIGITKRIEEILSNFKKLLNEVDFATLNVVVNETGFEYVEHESEDDLVL
ncbi:unnamed protein product, partial [Rotaria magnacalcarata]